MVRALGITPFVLCSVAAALILVLFVSCTSPAQQSAAQDLAETITAATHDGVVTAEEQDLIASKMKAYADAPKTDWGGLAATALGTLTTVFLGIRILPNKHLIGGAEAAALDKLSTPPAPAP